MTGRVRARPRCGLCEGEGERGLLRSQIESCWGVRFSKGSTISTCILGFATCVRDGLPGSKDVKSNKAASGLGSRVPEAEAVWVPPLLSVERHRRRGRHRCRRKHRARGMSALALFTHRTSYKREVSSYDESQRPTKLVSQGHRAFHMSSLSPAVLRPCCTLVELVSPNAVPSFIRATERMLPPLEILMGPLSSIRIDSEPTQADGGTGAPRTTCVDTLDGHSQQIENWVSLHRRDRSTRTAHTTEPLFAFC